MYMDAKLAPEANGVAPNTVKIRDKVASFLKEAPNRETKDLLREVLAALDAPYDLDWVRKEYKLSPTEYRVLRLLMEGKPAAAISESTGAQVSTVRVHISKIYRKLNVGNFTELAALLLQRARFV